MVEVPSQTNTPKNKVLAATGGAAVGSAVAVVLIWAIQKAGIEVPANVADALSVILTAILTFVSGMVHATWSREGEHQGVRRHRRVGNGGCTLSGTHRQPLGTSLSA